MHEAKAFRILGLVILLFGLTDARPQWWKAFFRDKSNCVVPGYFVNPYDCTKFFRCVDHSSDGKYLLVRYDFECPGGTVFDEALSTCNFPGVDGCAPYAGYKPLPYPPPPGSAGAETDSSGENGDGDDDGIGGGGYGRPGPKPSNPQYNKPPPPQPPPPVKPRPPPPGFVTVVPGHTAPWGWTPPPPRPANPEYYYPPFSWPYYSYPDYPSNQNYVVVYTNSKKFPQPQPHPVPLAPVPPPISHPHVHPPVQVFGR